MGLFGKNKKAGEVYYGDHAYFDSAEAAHLSLVPGFYAIDVAGQPVQRLTAVDDAPGDENDGSWHLEVAGKGDPITRARGPYDRAPQVVPLQAATSGSAKVRS